MLRADDVNNANGSTIWTISASPRPLAKRRSAPATRSMKEDAENAQMMKMYREHVLGVKPTRRSRPAQRHRPGRSQDVEKKEEVGSFGD